MSEGLRRYLFWCVNDHQCFRIPEFETLAELFGIDLVWVEKNVQEPWIIVDLPDDDSALKISSRSISTKYCVHIWGDGQDYESLHKSVQAFPKEEVLPYCSPDKSFKVYVEAFMNKLSVKERLQRIESFSYLPFQGPVKMDNPDIVFSNFEFSGFDHNNLPEQPLRIFFGRCLSEGRRELITKLSIKTRKFIGNTTMDPQLSLFMANLAKVRPGDVVLDPFVGTGSLLLAAAEFGCYVMGSDIDFLMLHARTRPSRKGQKKRALDESMMANFQQYGLLSQYLDVVVSDFSKPPFCKKLYRAIITDPPYGIREPTTKVGTTKENVVIPEEVLAHHIPQKIEYGFGEIFSDLLNFAAEYLEDGGRLVYWIPVLREDYREADLPRHASLRLVANCEQVLSSHTSRRLLVMEKIRSPSTSGDVAIVPKTLNITATEFREQFFKHQEMPRRERKERIKKYGHLNIRGDIPE